MFERDVQFLAAFRLLEPPERMAVGDAEQGEDAEDAGAQPREPGDIGDDQERADELRRGHGCRTHAWRRQVRALHLRDDRSEVEQAPAYTDILRSFSRTSNVMRRSGCP